jgi:hypothetical protein
MAGAQRRVARWEHEAVLEEMQTRLHHARDDVTKILASDVVMKTTRE